MPTKTSKDHEKTIKTVAKGAGIAFIGGLLGNVFSYLIRIFIAKSMGAEVYGQISIGVAILSVVTTVSLLGLNPGLVRFVSYFRGKNNFQKIKGGFYSSLKITIPISLFFAFFLFFFSGKISIGFFSDSKLIPIIKIFSLGIPFSVLMYITSSFLLGFKMVKHKTYMTDLAKNLSTLILVVLFFYLGFGSRGFAFAFVLGFLLSSFLGVFFLFKKIFKKIKQVKHTLVTKELFYFSFPLLLSNIMALVMSWTDTLMLGYFEVSSNVGIYNSALNTCVLLRFVLPSFGAIFLPLISEYISQNKHKKTQEIYKITTRWILFLVFPLFLLFLLFPDNILFLLFGEGFTSGSTSLIILSFGFLITAGVGLTTKTIIAIGKSKINFYLNSLAAISNFFLNLLLIPIYGMVGAAIAMSTSLIIWNLSSLFYLYIKTGIQPYTKNHLKPIFSALMSAVLFYIIIKEFLGTTVVNLILGFVGFFVSYVLLFLVLGGLTKDDLIILRSLEDKTGLKIEWLRNIIKKFS